MTAATAASRTSPVRITLQCGLTAQAALTVGCSGAKPLGSSYAPSSAGTCSSAQAAPGPNVLFIALLGWNVGINAGGPGVAGWLLGALGMAVCMLGVMLPSSLLTWTATRWGHRNRERRGVRAFKQGMAPVVIGLLVATSWVLARAHGEWTTDWPLWLLTASATVLVWRTKLHLLWMLGAGALLGALGLV